MKNVAGEEEEAVAGLTVVVVIVRAGEGEVVRVTVAVIATEQKESPDQAGRDPIISRTWDLLSP